MIGAALARTGVRARAVADRPDGNSRLRHRTPTCSRITASMARRSRARCWRRAGGASCRPPASRPTSMYPNFVPHWIADAEVAVEGRRASFEKRSPDRRSRRSRRWRAAAPRKWRTRCRRPRGAAEAGAAAPVPKRGADSRHARRSCCASASRSSARSSRPKPASRGRTPSPKSASSADLAIFMEGEGSRFYGKTMPSPIPNRTVQTLRSPIGICAAIMPFNSPLAGIAWKVFPALLCGNAVVVEVARADAVHRGRVRQAAEGRRPAGRRLLGACRASAPMSARRSCRTHRVGVVSFTGSSATGKLIQKIVSERDGAREGLPRAGRQEPVRRVRRRGSRAGGGARGGIGVHRCRPALRLGQPHHRVRSRLRRVPRGVARARRAA